MGKTMNQNLQVLTKLTDGQFVKMVTQLLLSLSLFSFLFSQPALLSLIHSLNLCLSTFPYQLFTHTIDKKCIFLLCNGLLVFLAKYSGLIRSSRVDESDPNHMVIDVSQSDQLPTMPQYKGLIVLDKDVGVESDIVGLEDNVALEEEVNEKEIETEKAIIEDIKREQGSEFKDSKDSNEEEEEEEEEEKELVHVSEDMCEEVEENIDWSSGFEEEYEEEEEEEEIGNGKLSTEEMDKKFDEFIRRMKEGLRIEAQRHVIMV